MNNWIPVEERVPERGYWLVTGAGQRVREAFYTGKIWRDELDSEAVIHNVTAWQPLPDPYQKPRRFNVVPDSLSEGTYSVTDSRCVPRFYVADHIPTREAAERIADIYEDVCP